MIFSMALGIVGLTFSVIILCLYFWKKRANVEGTLTTLFYRFLVIFLVILGFYEIVCVVSMANASSHPILNEILCRIHILLDIIWAAVFMVYIYSVTRNKNDDLMEYIKSRRVLAMVIVVAVIITYIASCMLKVTYHSAVNPNFFVIGGPALYPVYVIAGVGCIAITIIMLKFKNTLVKNLRFPVIYFVVLFAFLVAIEFIFFDYRVNYIYFVFCFLHMGMFFTIESQDKRLLTKVENGRKEAEIANKAKTEFLSNISHEIRTPMNTILGFSQALLEENKLTEDIVKRDAVNIREASANLLELINNILDISRIESGKEIIDTKDYKLEDLLMEVNSIIFSKISKDVLEFKINVDPNIPTMYNGDSNKLYKILINVLLNAITHTKFGSVSLDVGGAYVGDSFKLSFVISNNGHEMTEAEFNKSFEDFAEGTSTNSAVDSVKLGLIVAKRLIEIVDGTIDFKNEKGKGTRYIISIDQKVIDDMRIGNLFIESKFSDDKAYDFSNKKVLVVDDNKINLKLAERLLSQFNMNIKTAENGKECIDLVKNNSYDIILLDHMMPELDGVATVHILRESGITTPVIALTANSYTGSKDNYIKEGFTDYLAKPIRYKDLYRLLAKYLTTQEGK